MVLTFRLVVDLILLSSAVVHEFHTPHGARNMKLLVAKGHVDTYLLRGAPGSFVVCNRDYKQPEFSAILHISAVASNTTRLTTHTADINLLLLGSNVC
jgi:ABC-type uncharacterized transport system permease subunit